MAEQKRTFDSESLQISNLKLRPAKPEPFLPDAQPDKKRSAVRKTNKMQISRDLILRVIAGLKDD